MPKELTQEQKDNMIRVDILNFNNVCKLLVAEKVILQKFIKNRKPILNREGKDIVGPALNGLGMSIVNVTKHFEDRISEMEKTLAKDKS